MSCFRDHGQSQVAARNVVERDGLHDQHVFEPRLIHALLSNVGSVRVFVVVNTRSIKRTNRNADENPGLTSERLPIPFQEGGCPARLGWLSQVMNRQKHSLTACRKWYYKRTVL